MHFLSANPIAVANREQLPVLCVVKYFLFVSTIFPNGATMYELIHIPTNEVIHEFYDFETALIRCNALTFVHGPNYAIRPTFEEYSMELDMDYFNHNRPSVTLADDISILDRPEEAGAERPNSSHGLAAPRSSTEAML